MLESRSRRGRAAALIAILAILAVLAGVAAHADSAAPAHGLGRAPTPAEIAAWDIAIGPLGEELPPGGGTAHEGALVFAEKCAACHGATGQEGPDPVLAGGRNSLASRKPLLTIGSFWPYATTIFDYVYRAMPFYAPGSLTADEVYALTAFLLHINSIIAGTDRVDARSLPRIEMPNREGFVPDPRPDVGATVNAPSAH